MNYAQFVTELENCFLYELFNIPYYGEIDENFPLKIKSFIKGDGGRYATKCSVFDYNELYLHYQEAKSHGWELDITLLWTAIQLLNIVMKRAEEGTYGDELFDEQMINQMKYLVYDYTETFKAITGKKENEKMYPNDIHSFEELKERLIHTWPDAKGKEYSFHSYCSDTEDYHTDMVFDELDDLINYSLEFFQKHPEGWVS